jgi:hypothetical protein
MPSLTLRRAPLRAAPALVALLVAVLGAPLVRHASAQLPGIPTAPGAFVGPGIGVAANAGAERASGIGGESERRWSYGLAGAYAPTSARWQVAGGAAAQQWGEGYKSPGLAFGGRATVPVWRRARLGASAFAGVGVARASFEDAGQPGDEDDAASLRQIPVGVAVGLRGALGTRAWSLSVSPQLVFYQFSVGDESLDASRLRVGVLGEVALTSRIGIGVAFEDGARASRDEPGPRGSTLGLGLSLALGAR